MSGGAAASMGRTAKRLRQAPTTAAAWSGGVLSGGQVQAMVANVDERAGALFAEHESSLVPALAELSVRDTALAMQAWRARAEALLDDADQPEEAQRSLHLSQTLDGRRELKGFFDAEAGEVVATALRLAASPDAEGEPDRSPAERRADALVDVCRFFLDHQDHVAAGRHRPHLNVVIDYDDLVAGAAGRLVNDGFVDPAGMRRLLCDAAIHRVVVEGRSSILDYGTATRSVPANLWSALVLRDRHCRHPGCDRPSAWCEAHHVIPVLEDGPTCLANLVLKCSRHHHIAHLPGWAEKLKPDATLVLTDPTGRTWETHPPGV
ncbi:MAG: HNH endonuclease [Actinomycetota bacterium]|nr:HNH endonuclease [Actinomycetota bacterium]